MRRILSVLLAALLLLSLAACGQEAAPAPETPEEPAVPETPDVPEEPTPEPEPEPEAEPEPEDTPAPDPESSGVSVETVTSEGSVEDMVSYTIAVPQVATGSDAVDQILNDYYTAAAGKVEDLCWGDLYVEVMEQQMQAHVDASFTVERNDGEILSICRTVTVNYLQTGSTMEDQQILGETFRVSDGGLLTAGDFFSVPEEQWTDRLADGVARIISEDPYHAQHYAADWQTACAALLDRDAFYVTGDAFVVLYQPGALGPEAETAFPIPWSSLADITT